VYEVDGGYGEGGGQLLRLAVALAAIDGRAIRVTNVRAGREKPGLAPQHLAGVRAVGALCGARIEGLAVRSQTVSFVPASVRGGEHRFDVGTAGSVTLVLQALLPVMLAARTRFEVHLTGGTDVRQAPPADYSCQVLVPLLERLGARVSLRVMRRGYYPRGGGEIEVVVRPASLAPATLGALMVDALATPIAIRGVAHVAHLPEHVAARMRSAALERLGVYAARASIETRVLARSEAYGPGGAIACWADAGHTVLGAARAAERGVRAETLGEAVGAELAADLAAGAALDAHAADQMLVGFALAGGGGFATRAVSRHARTAMWLIEQFLPVSFEVTESAGLAHVVVRPDTRSSAMRPRRCASGSGEVSGSGSWMSRPTPLDAPWPATTGPAGPSPPLVQRSDPRPRAAPSSVRAG
jgi:RNA 3'-terminal phosphate cyclase (ATP)